MFDVGFSEMLVIAIVALIVIGPERLPAVARTVGTLLGRFRRYANDVKAEVNRELRLEEVRKMQQQLAEQASVLEQKAKQEIAEVSDSVTSDLASGPKEENRILPPNK
jgi:sec-independent protein translocase protein TatB